MLVSCQCYVRQRDFTHYVYLCVCLYVRDMYAAARARSLSRQRALPLSRQREFTQRGTFTLSRQREFTQRGHSCTRESCTVCTAAPQFNSHSHRRAQKRAPTPRRHRGGTEAATGLPDADGACCRWPAVDGDDLESPGRVDELVAFGPRDLLLARCSWRVVSARAAGAEAGGGCWQPGARVTGSTRVPARCPAWARCVARGAWRVVRVCCGLRRGAELEDTCGPPGCW